MTAKRVKNRLFLLVLTLLTLPGQGDASDLTLSIGQSVPGRTLLPLPLAENLKTIDLNIYTADLGTRQMGRIKSEFENAQTKLKKCDIQINVKNVFPYSSNSNFKQFESIEFNGGKVSDWERLFFSTIESLTPAVLYVDSLDWTVEDNGTIAVAYPEYYLGLADLKRADREFYRKKMVSSTVMGGYRGRWTLVHELGHSLFNLKHNEANPDNIMYPLGFARSKNPEFNHEQCEQAMLYLEQINNKSDKEK